MVNEHEESAEFTSLYELLNEGRTIGDLVTLIEEIGIWSKDKYGRDTQYTENENPTKINQIKKALLKYEYIISLDLTADGTEDEVDFAENWSKLNKNDNSRNIYLNSGWFGDEYLSYETEIIEKGEKTKSHDFNPYLLTLDSKVKYLENIFPDWKIKVGHITNTDNLTEWIREEAKVNTREAEILKKALSVKFPELIKR